MHKKQRFWLLLREYENLIMCDMTNFGVERKGRYKKKK